MKTASFFRYSGPGRVSIARRQPPRFAPCPNYPALAPPATWSNLDRPEIEGRYAALLARLDARAVWADLHKLAGNAEPHILCWEWKPDTWPLCHRRLVAQWSEDQLGERVPEWGQE